MFLYFKPTTGDEPIVIGEEDGLTPGETLLVVYPEPLQPSDKPVTVTLNEDTPVEAEEDKTKLVVPSNTTVPVTFKKPTDKIEITPTSEIKPEDISIVDEPDATVRSIMKLCK